MTNFFNDSIDAKRVNLTRLDSMEACAIVVIVVCRT